MSTYWNGAGRHQDLASDLRKLVPDFGPCKQPQLDRFRRAVNCYYDLHNNGLCNRASEFRQIFRISKARAEIDPVSLENRMDAIVLAAAEEQGLLINSKVC